jgi:membrane protease YdiL (CAAX protease family)
MSGRARVASAGELLLGVFVVIGHNVLRILPNEVPILVALGLLSMRLRDGRWSAIGFRRPSSWTRLLLIAAAAAALRIGLGYAIEAVAERFWPPIVAPSGAEEITGNLKVALLYLLLVWSFAAFGEEIAYRGYLLTRAADVGNRTTAAYWAGVVMVAVVFGYGHYYKGMLAGRNLWASVLAHGFIDTAAIVLVYFGLDD